MLRTILTAFISLLVSLPVLSAHIVSETREGGVVVKRIHTYSNTAGDLRIDEEAMHATASASDAAGSTRSTTSYTPGARSDTMLYQSKGQAVVSLEGKVCRRMTADSAPPPGMPAGMDMKQMNEQMTAAMSQANKAMEEAMRQARQQGMTKEQERAMEQWTKPLMNAQAGQQRREVEIQKLNDTVTVAGFKGDGYSVTDERGHRHRVWLAPAGKIPGAKQVRAGMTNMYQVFSSYLDQMGGAGLFDGGLFAVYMKGEFADMYPIRMENMDTGEVTQIVSADADDSSTDFYPDCEVQDMFGR